MTAFTDRLSRAVDYARIAHARQVRKGTHVPYLSHVLGFAALVVEYGGNEDQAIAGLLHDTIEDHGQAHEAMIRALFDEAVVDIVVACTDASAEARAAQADPETARANWYARKRAHPDNAIDADDKVLLAMPCQQLHNARPHAHAPANPPHPDAPPAGTDRPSTSNPPSSPPPQPTT